MKFVSFLGLTILLVSLAQPTAVAKGTEVGIYAVMDQVVFGPRRGMAGLGPDIGRIRCSRPDVEWQIPGAAARLFLYLRIPPGDEYWTRKEWSRLKSLAGTGQVFRLGSYWAANSPGQNRHQPLEVRVRNASDTATPEIYPFSYTLGIVEAGALSFDATIAARLPESLQLT